METEKQQNTTIFENRTKTKYIKKASQDGGAIKGDWRKEAGGKGMNDCNKEIQEEGQDKCKTDVQEQ